MKRAAPRRQLDLDSFNVYKELYKLYLAAAFTLSCPRLSQIGANEVNQIHRRSLLSTMMQLSKEGISNRFF